MDPISLIVAGAGSIAGIVLSGLASKVFKAEKGAKISIRFKDGQTTAVELTPDMDEYQRERLICQTIEQKTSLSTLGAFIRYLVEAISGIVVFGVFVLTSMAVRWIGDALGMPEFAIVFRIVGLTITVLGAICCFALVFRNTIAFIKFLYRKTNEASK